MTFDGDREVVVLALFFPERRCHVRLDRVLDLGEHAVGEQRRLEASPRLALVLQALDAARPERDVRDAEDRDRREHLEQRESTQA